MCVKCFCETFFDYINSLEYEWDARTLGDCLDEQVGVRACRFIVRMEKHVLFHLERNDGEGLKRTFLNDSLCKFKKNGHNFAN